MNNIALLIGTSWYENLDDLPCCKADVDAIEDLLAASKKYKTIQKFVDLNSTELKDTLRSYLDSVDEVEELFIYYSGHGYATQEEFYFCPTNFLASHRNQTGLSLHDLHQLLRAKNASLVVSVIDACHSGSRLIKNSTNPTVLNKAAFNHHIQISSSLENQYSLAGDPLSEFTSNFVKAAISKVSGPVYFTDITSNLRDFYLTNEAQTPYFVSQATGRELFAESGELFSNLRNAQEPKQNEQSSDIHETETIEATNLNDLQKLRLVAENFSSKDDAQKFIDDFLAQLAESLNDLRSSHEGIYQLEIEKSDDFYFDESKQFITSVLSRQPRYDNFVTARVKKLINDPQGNSILDSFKVTMGQLSGRKVEYQYILELNCVLDDVEFIATFTPELKNLKQVKLCVSFAPSIDCCFIFENTLTYDLRDWNNYSYVGNETTRRWYKLGWRANANIPDLVKKISSALVEVINNDIHQAVERINQFQKN